LPAPVPQTNPYGQQPVMQQQMETVYPAGQFRPLPGRGPSVQQQPGGGLYYDNQVESAWGQAYPSQQPAYQQSRDQQVAQPYQQRPWGEIPSFGKRKNNSQVQHQQPWGTVQHESSPGYGGNPSMSGYGYGPVPYGLYPGIGYPGYAW